MREFPAIKEFALGLKWQGGASENRSRIHRQAETPVPLIQAVPKPAFAEDQAEASVPHTDNIRSLVKKQENITAKIETPGAAFIPLDNSLIPVKQFSDSRSAGLRCRLLKPRPAASGINHPVLVEPADAPRSRSEDIANCSPAPCTTIMD